MKIVIKSIIRESIKNENERRVSMFVRSLHRGQRQQIKDTASDWKMHHNVSFILAYYVVMMNYIQE